MGIKGLYGYCNRSIPECHRTVNILEEITKYKSEHGKGPRIIINLATLSYHFKLNTRELLCGYQLNKIKFILENFLSQLKAAGAELDFVFKKSDAGERDFMSRRLRDYQIGCGIIELISKNNDFEKLTKILHADKFPYNYLILVALLQSAHKFGPVHGFNSFKGKPSVQQIQLAREIDADFIMGLDTYYFMLPSKNWKIWCDTRINMEDMTVQELDPKLVMKHFNLQPNEAPLFACLVGDLRSSKISNKVVHHFGKNLFPTAAKFMNKLEAGSMDIKIEEIVEKIFGTRADPQAVDDFKLTVKSFEIDDNFEACVDKSLLEMVKNDFMSFAEEILLNLPIFISPSFLDLRSNDMKSINDLVMPLIQKTAGVLLKSSEDFEPRTLILLADHDADFSHYQIEAIIPGLKIPPLEVLFAGDMSTPEKMDLLFWITDLEVLDAFIKDFPEEYVADCLILIYLLKNESLKLIDARCILKTLVDARCQSFEFSTEYPDKINDRAFRCSFLYSKMYFIFQSCLAALGMKNLCSEIQFDGVYFQKIYALNILDEEGKEVATDDEIPANNLNFVEILDEFITIIRM